MSTIFLDRDGTINIDSGYVSDASSLELIPGAARALGNLKRAGWELVVVSNQSGLGRGLIKPEQLTEVNLRLVELLSAEDPDAVLDYSFFCPHRPDEGCACRKPKAGMLDSYLREAELDESSCWVVGDKLSDTGLAKTLGIPEKQRVLVKTGKGSSEIERISALDYEPVIVESLVEASELILR